MGDRSRRSHQPPADDAKPSAEDAPVADPLGNQFLADALADMREQMVAGQQQAAADRLETASLRRQLEATIGGGHAAPSVAADTGRAPIFLERHGDSGASRERKKDGEPDFSAKQQHSGSYDQSKTPSEHKEFLFDQYPTAPWLRQVADNSCLLEHQHDGPSTDVRNAIKVMNNSMLTEITNSGAGDRHDVYVDIFTGQRHACAEQHATLKADGNKGSRFQQLYRDFSITHPINSSRYCAPGGNTNLLDDTNNITNVADWNRIDTLLASQIRDYAVLKPQALGASLSCEGVLIATFDNHATKPLNRSFRLWQVLAKSGPDPGNELRRLKKFHSGMRYDSSCKLSLFVAALIRIHKLHAKVDCSSDPEAPKRASNKIAENEALDLILLMCDEQLGVNCGLANTLTKAYRAFFSGSIQT
jgi:hypothetical protein